MRARRRTVLGAVLVAAAGLVPAGAHGDDIKSTCIAAADQGQAARDDQKLRSARDAFTTCSQSACPRLIAKSCKKWLADVDAALPSIAVTARDDEGGTLADAQVKIDGVATAGGATPGSPVDIDPGDHVLRVERAGSDPVEQRITVKAGQKSQRIDVVLHPTQPQATDSGPHTPPEHPSVFTARNVVAGAMLVAGIGAGVGGAYFLSQSGSASGNASGLRGSLPSTHCTDVPSDPVCQQLTDAVNQQHNDQTLGIAMIAGGGALAAGAVVVWLAWPSPKTVPAQTGLRWVSPAPALGGGMTLQAGGAW